MNYPSGVTRIEDLPDVDDLENYGGGSGRYSGYGAAYGHNETQHASPYDRPGISPSDDQIRSKIRNTGGPIPAESGMGNSYQSREQMHENYMMQRPQQALGSRVERMEMPDYRPTLSCQDIAEHIKNCAICTKFYGSDNTIYIIVIIVLAIICILLMKRVLDI